MLAAARYGSREKVGTAAPRGAVRPAAHRRDRLPKRATGAGMPHLVRDGISDGTSGNGCERLTPAQQNAVVGHGVSPSCTLRVEQTAPRLSIAFSIQHRAHLQVSAKAILLATMNPAGYEHAEPPPDRMPPSHRQLFAERLRLHRRRAGLDQKAMAAIVGVAQSTISEWEGTGPSSPSVPELATLCDFFRVSADYLTGRTNAENGLTPHAWIVDMDFVEQVEAGELPAEQFGESGAVAIPNRSRIVSSSEYEKLERRLRPLLERLQRLKRKERGP